MKKYIFLLGSLFCILHAHSQSHTICDTNPSDCDMSMNPLQVLNVWLDVGDNVSVTISNLKVSVDSPTGTGDKFNLSSPGFTIKMLVDSTVTPLLYNYHFPSPGGNDPCCNTWTTVPDFNLVTTVKKRGKYLFYLEEPQYYHASLANGEMHEAKGSIMKIVH
jgi:hypothetical protein